MDSDTCVVHNSPAFRGLPTKDNAHTVEPVSAEPYGAALEPDNQVAGQPSLALQEISSRMKCDGNHDGVFGFNLWTAFTHVGG
jgi:hypothetical protein